MVRDGPGFFHWIASALPTIAPLRWDPARKTPSSGAAELSDQKRGRPQANRDRSDKSTRREPETGKFGHLFLAMGLVLRPQSAESHPSVAMRPRPARAWQQNKTTPGDVRDEVYQSLRHSVAQAKRSVQPMRVGPAN